MKGIAGVRSVETLAAVPLALLTFICSSVTSLPLYHSIPEAKDESVHQAPHRVLTDEVGCDSDDALDSLEPRDRARVALIARVAAAATEYRGSEDVCQTPNGDTTLWAKFHKSLPHDDLGQVDADAYTALEECISSGDFDTCEAVPSGDPNGFLVNPLGGIAVDLAGPAGSATSMIPAPELDSDVMAGHMGECYWMALTRDVPFSQYGVNDVTIAAAENLEGMPGFPLASSDVAIHANGTIDPLKHLFRPSFIGVDKGPMISQLLVHDYTMDSIKSSPLAYTFAPGIDYMTDWDSFLHIQNGGAKDGPEEMDDTKRYIRNARDLARMVFTDTIYTEAFRGTLVLLEKGAINAAGFNGPYEGSMRQKGFVQHGVSHVMRFLGGCEGAQRASFYQKWNVHLTLRPEALGGAIHNVLMGLIDVSIHKSLLENTELLDRVASANAAQNEANGVPGETYLLSQAVKDGSPVHPSYPAGHAVQNGAFATALKAFVGLNRGLQCFPDPKVADDDGLGLLDYDPTPGEMCVGADGLQTQGVTFEGEINKLASNVAFGRQMLGVHYRFDSTEGIILGETITIRMLQQEVMAFPEAFAYEFRLFRGDTIRLQPSGDFHVNGKLCEGQVYTGVGDC